MCVLLAMTVELAHLFVMRSADSGKTWTPLALHNDVPGMKCQSGLARMQGNNDAEADWLLLSGITRTDARGGNRRDLTAFLSRGVGRSWAKSKLLHKGPAAYSDTCVLGDRTVLCVYEGGARHRYESIRLARFNRAGSRTRRAEGQSDTVLRTKIDELVNTGTSIMPEGLEKQLSKQDMADLVTYLMSVK